ncbi:hypothetical protein [Sulfuriroseicoccus oceanibius]|uniref:Uncharacterized protein n=1 Tax=Sulfuriroseicoccus oceanibius TaxID=2707525 RepID=A0A6B3L3M9_9BACT|nr:hypothetical protein [Sulfuriroseicoccus oceanibius]QQL44686.1 hypothetical protein G3M56_012480 [Sulfuriroseicoccus oceanibius]
MPKDKDSQRVLREQAWTGDAVLALYTREWILREFGEMDGELMNLMSSNHFLSRVGNPTAVEAEIGRAYAAEGLEAGFFWIEKNLRAHMEDVIRKRRPHWVAKMKR